jgi:hypothetical protein
MTTLTLKYTVRTFERTRAGFVAACPLPTFDKVSHVQCWAGLYPYR